MTSARVITYYFWTLSDWAYLGHRRFVDLAAHHGVKVDYKPVDLPTVYAGTGGILLKERSRQRRDYRVAELRRWKARLDDPITLEPRFFPTDHQPSSRLLVAAKLAGLPLADLSFDVLRATWVEERDIAHPDTLREIASRHTADAEALIRSSQGQEVQREYERYTDEAPGHGVFGSPFYILDGEPFWGQDRLDFLANALAAGTNPAV